MERNFALRNFVKFGYTSRSCPSFPEIQENPVRSTLDISGNSNQNVWPNGKRLNVSQGSCVELYFKETRWRVLSPLRYPCSQKPELREFFHFSDGRLGRAGNLLADSVEVFPLVLVVNTPSRWEKLIYKLIQTSYLPDCLSNPRRDSSKKEINHNKFRHNRMEQSR